MNSKLDLTDAYRAYAVILEQGERVDGGHSLDGLAAYTDHDGYSVTLSDGTVSARLMFHSKIRFDAPSSRALQRFVRQVADIATRGSESTQDAESETRPIAPLPELKVV